MKRGLFSLFLLVVMLFTSAGLVGCGGFSSADAAYTGDAGFSLIDLVENAQNIFTIAKDTALLVSNAITLVTTIKANQTPPANTQGGTVNVVILYNKQGVESQDVYKVKTGSASLGIILQGGETFESFAASEVDIDATNTRQITIMPLQNATRNFTVSANKGWQDTGIFLKRGRSFEVKYLSGTWTISKGVVGTSDAAGQPVNAPADLFCRCGEPLPGYSTQAMIGRIGDGAGYPPLQVGDDFSGVAYNNEFLYLRINLPDSLLSYASGSITVSIQTNNN